MIRLLAPVARVAAAVLTIGVVAGLSGCGGGKVKIDVAKLQAVHKVAIVGVCTKDTFYGLAGISSSFTAEWGSAIVPHEAAAIDATLPTVWHGAEIMPFSAVAAKADLPRGAGDPDHVCAGGIDPLAKKDRPDAALMMRMADALEVDAVLAIWSSPAVRSTSKARVTGGSAVAYLVDRSGAVVVTAHIRGAESAEVDGLFSVGVVGANTRQLSRDEERLVGSSFGQALAARLGAALTGG